MKIVRLAAVALLVSCTTLPPVSSPSGSQNAQPGSAVKPGAAPAGLPAGAGQALGQDPFEGVQATIHGGQTDTLKLQIQLRRPPDYQAERLELDKIRRLQAWVKGEGVGASSEDRIMNLNGYITTSSTPGSQTSLQIQQVPRGKFRIVTVQGYDVVGPNYPEVAGATLKAVYDSPSNSTDVVLNFSWRSTLEAEIFEKLLDQAAHNPEIQQILDNLNRTDLGVFLDKLTYGTTPPEGSSLVLHPTRVDPGGIVQAIIDNNGQIPNYTPGSNVPPAWLKPMSDVSLVVRAPQNVPFTNSTIKVQITDPASEPVAIGTGSDTGALPKIVPGSWEAIVHIDGLNGGVTARTGVQVDASGNLTLAQGTTGNPVLLPPVIKQLSQTTGVSGSQLTINGDGFNAAVAAENLVKFAGVTANVVMATATSLLVDVPFGISDQVKVTVTSTGKTSNQGDFTVTRGITSISTPGVHTGDSLTLTISGYQPSSDTGSTVTFNGGTTAVVTNRTDTTITVTVPAGAQSGPVTVTPGSGGGAAMTSPPVAVNTPVITSFGPASGTGGTVVTVNGANLDNITSLTIGGVTVPAGNITMVDSNTVKVTVPNNAQTGPITITNPAGSASSSTDFTMNLAVVSLSNNTGLVGTPLTLNVAGFDPTNTPSTVVFPGGVTATVTGTTATGITVTVPPGAQSGPITVTPQGGPALQSPPFTVQTPAVTSLSSPGGVVGNSVTLNVSGFDPTAISSTVTFTGGSTATITGTTATSITVTVPAGAQTGPITVSAPSIGSLQSPTYTVNGPVITNVANLFGQTVTQAIPNQGLIISGVNFANASQVCFDTVCTSTFTRNGDVITVTVPPTATSGPIKVVTPAGTATSSFNIIAPPTITSLTPPTVGQTTLTVQGSSYSPVTQVTIGGTALAPSDYTINSDNTITINNLPPNPVLGVITITNPAGTAVSSLTYKDLINFIGNNTQAPRTAKHSTDFCGAHGINVDSAGNIYVADIGCNYNAPYVAYGYHNGIHKFDANGNHLWSTGSSALSLYASIDPTNASFYYGQVGYTDGTIASSRFSSPEDVANDNQGNLYVADTSNHAIRKIIAATGQVVTLARVPGPEGLEITTDGKLYVSGNYPPNPGTLTTSNLAYVLRIDDLDTIPANLATLPYDPNAATETSRWSSNVIKVAGGNVVLTKATGEVDASVAKFNHLEGLAIDGQNRVYIADVENYQIRRYDPATGKISIFASMSSTTPSNSAPTIYVHEIRADKAGNLFVPSPTQNPGLGVYMINPAGKISLVAGSSTSGLNDGDVLKQATFVSPRGIDFGPDGALYIADTGWGVRKVERFNPAPNLQMP